MKKKTIRFLNILLIFISINSSSYAGFIESEINESWINNMKVLLYYILDDMRNFYSPYNYTREIFGKRLEFYVFISIILLYTILNIIIIKKDKRLLKVNVKMDIIILLSILTYATYSTRQYEGYIKNLMILAIIIVLLISLIIKKILLKREDKIIKKHDNILKVIILILLIIEIFNFKTTYNHFFYVKHNRIEKDEKIILEVIHEYNIPGYHTRYNKRIYGKSTGEQILGNDILNFDDNGVLLKSLKNYYVGKEEDFNNQEVSEEIKLKWNTWYQYIDKNSTNSKLYIMKDGDTDVYIRLNRID